MTWNEGHFVENVFERERVDAVLRGRLFATGRADKDAVLASVEVVEELSRNRREVTGQRFLSAAHCVVGAAAGHMNVLSADSLNSLHRIVRTVRSNHDTVIADEMWRTLYIGLCTSFAQEDDADTAILHHLAGLPLLTACVLCEVLHRGGGGIPAGTAERIFTRVDHALRGDNDALREEAMSRHLWLLFQRYTFFWKTREFFRVAASVRTALVARLQEATPSEMHIHQQVFSLISVQRILDEHPRLGNVRMGPSEAAFLELLNPSTLTSLASRAARDVLATFFLFERDALDNKRDPVITQAAHPILHSTLMSDILPNALEQIVAGGAGRMRLMSVVQAAGWVDLLLTRLSQDEGGPTEGKGYRVPVAAVFVAVFASLHNLEVQGERKEAKEGHRLQSLHDTVVRLFKGEEKLSMQASYLAQTSRLSESGGGMLLVDTSSSYLQHITQRDIVAMHRLLMNASHCTSLGETFCKNVRLYAAQVLLILSKQLAGVPAKNRNKNLRKLQNKAANASEVPKQERRDSTTVAAAQPRQPHANHLSKKKKRRRNRKKKSVKS